MDEIRKLHNEFKNSNARFNTRRHFLKECTLGLGGIALGSFLNSCSSKNVSFNYNADRSLNPLAPIAPPFSPKVKSVIYLHMVGAPSQLELFWLQAWTTEVT